MPATVFHTPPALKPSRPQGGLLQLAETRKGPTKGPFTHFLVAGAGLTATALRAYALSRRLLTGAPAPGRLG